MIQGFKYLFWIPITKYKDIITNSKKVNTEISISVRATDQKVKEVQ